ncbi:autotransporter outer membrane beta-barrel domain-containing protein [Citrobacter braakii]|uniref:autotransporter outer membrane beta-barrel domain-containing protein n=1 Tax=Citrobacter braakii TaxID=57706 RepID=UPI00403A1B6A
MYARVEEGVLALNNATLALTLPDTTTSAGPGAGALTVAESAVLSSAGASSVLGDVDNAGGIRLSGQHAGGNGVFTGDRLTIAGNYTGRDNASLVLDTHLGDDSSPTDKFVIQGNAEGSTSVIVNNAGGAGALTHSGISIIEVGGRHLTMHFC